MKDLFTIGEMSKLFRINIRTLRYYDAIGLLKPEYVDGQTGYRYYCTRQFERLNTILYMRALDMPISQISRFFADRNVDTVLDVFREQLCSVKEKQQELMQIEKKICARIRQIEDARSMVPGRIEIKSMKCRETVMLKKPISISEDLEYPIRDLERQNHLDAAIFLGKIGVSVSEGNLHERQFVSFSSIFAILEEGDRYQGRTEPLPAGEYLTVRFDGTHRESSRYYNILLDYMEENGYETAGDSVEITLIDSGMTKELSDFVTELQIPLRKRRGM